MVKGGAGVRSGPRGRMLFGAEAAPSGPAFVDVDRDSTASELETALMWIAGQNREWLADAGDIASGTERGVTIGPDGVVGLFRGAEGAGEIVLPDGLANIHTHPGSFSVSTFSVADLRSALTRALTMKTTVVTAAYSPKAKPSSRVVMMSVTGSFAGAPPSRGKELSAFVGRLMEMRSNAPLTSELVNEARRLGVIQRFSLKGL